MDSGQVRDGASLRVRSLVRNLDALGFDLQVRALSRGPETAPHGFDSHGIRGEFVSYSGSPWIATRMAFRLFPSTRLSARVLTPAAPKAADVARSFFTAAPDGVVVFEYLQTAAAVLSIGQRRTIWDCHDIPSHLHNVAAAHRSLRRTGRAAGLERSIGKLERAVARRAGLVVCSSSADSDFIRREWGCPQAMYLPTSPGLESSRRRPSQLWSAAPRVRILHAAGSYGHAPNATSLATLVDEIWPLLPREAHERLELLVTGAWPAEADEPPEARALRERASRHANIRLLGLVDDLDSVWAEAHALFVAPRAATGARTKTLEAFAQGVPVLGNALGRQGIEGVVPGRNFLQAERSGEFASLLASIALHPELLAPVAAAAADLYEQEYTPRATAMRLAEGLREFGIADPPAAGPRE